ncbi:flagellar biosynthetic protein FliO [Alteromonas facilis]|uniref:flagellar biosynthetic protein FliO n=1 Tax=Alteromonas facilis TaxID=2048004 RepID=UPI000C291BB1|nr:flagellar biosynthetic protein FliO [Alteromonas facilis]
MLLVKSRESKSSGSLNKKSVVKSIGYALPFIALSSFSSVAFATETQSSMSSAGDIVSIFLSLLVVVGIIFALAFVMRRFNVAHTGQGDLKVVASMVAGTKERVMVVEVGDEQYLLGVTAHNISHLATLPNKITPKKSEVADQFKQKLVQAMAGKLNPASIGEKP